MSATQSNADQIAFWNGDAGQKWVRGQERLDAMLADATSALFKAARLKPTDTVLDIGCGCGDTSIAIAKVGAKVTGIDISAPMLARARSRAPDIRFIETDASTHQFLPDYDVLFSRFGVMFFANPDEAFRNLKSALKPGGRLAFVCWRDWRENEWVRVPMSVVRPLVPPQPQMGPEDPGPFAFADLVRVRRILSYAGFDEITAHPVDTRMTLGEGLDDAVSHITDFGPVSRMLADATPQTRTTVLDALATAFKPFASRKPFTMGGAVWIVTARA